MKKKLITSLALSLFTLGAHAQLQSQLSFPSDGSIPYPGVGAGVSNAHGSGDTGFLSTWRNTDDFSTGGATGFNIRSVTWSTPTNYGFTPTGNAIGRSAGGNSSSLASRAFTTASDIRLDQANQVYFSFLYQHATGAGSDLNFTDSSGNDLFRVRNNGTTFAAQSGTSGFNALSDSLSNGGQYLVVGRITSVSDIAFNDRMELAIYSSSDTISGEPTWTVSPAATVTGALLKSDATIAGIHITNYTGTTNYFDEFRTGATFADVTGVPEPSAYALIAGCLALGWIMIRRRK